MQENLRHRTRARRPFYARVYFSLTVGSFLAFVTIAVQMLTGAALSPTNVSACRPHWCIRAASSQAAEVAPRDPRFWRALPDRPAHIHGGKVQRDC